MAGRQIVIDLTNEEYNRLQASGRSAYEWLIEAIKPAEEVEEPEAEESEAEESEQEEITEEVSTVVRRASNKNDD